MFGGEYLSGIAAADQSFPVLLLEREGLLMRAFALSFGNRSLTVRAQKDLQRRDRKGTVYVLATAALLMAAPAPAVIVDRVAATVGIKVITDSEIDLRIRLTAFQNDDKPDMSLAAR